MAWARAPLSQFIPSDPEEESMESGAESKLGLEYGGLAGPQLDDSRDLEVI